MALYMFNFSVDAPDWHPDYMPEDLTINDMESIVEIVLEKIAKIENAIPEHEEKDGEHKSLSTLKKALDLYQHYTLIRLIHRDVTVSSSKSPWQQERFAEQNRPEIFSPPPEC